jgi:hypothetical protein
MENSARSLDPTHHPVCTARLQAGTEGRHITYQIKFLLKNPLQILLTLQGYASNFAKGYQGGQRYKVDLIWNNFYRLSM